MIVQNERWSRFIGFALLTGRIVEVRTKRIRSLQQGRKRTFNYVPQTSRKAEIAFLTKRRRRELQ